MSIAQETNGTTERPSIIPRRTPEEQRERNARLIAALDRAVEIGDADEQEETLAVLRAAGLVAPEGERNP